MARRRLVVAVAVGLLAGVAFAADPTPSRARAVTVRGDRVSLNVERMRAQDVLRDIARQTGSTLQGEVLEGREVTLDLDAVSLREAVQRVLGEQSFTLTYGDDGKLRTIALRGGPEAAVTTTTLGSVPIGPDETPPGWRAVFVSFDHRKKIPLRGRLAQHIGRDAVAWDYLGNTAFYDDDPRIRTEAVRTGLRAFEEDEALQQALFEAAAGMSDAEMAELIRSICKQRSRDLVKRIGRLTDRPEVRARAGNILRELREQERRSASAGG
jgi:hypothetical protein